jgi:tetratricopeptide (TPR) repeat protein
MTIKILFLAANPSDTNHLRLDEESRAIDQALRTAQFRDQFEIKTHWAVRADDLQELLLRYQPDIVHFSGHGSSAGEIILEDNQGQSHPVPKDALSKLFAVLKGNLRCVVINACYSEDQARAITDHVDCVVGMSKPVSDIASIDFATAFYRALANGKDTQTAFDLGCQLIHAENLGEQDTPQLIAAKRDPKKIVLAKPSIGFNVEWILGLVAIASAIGMTVEYTRLWGGDIRTGTYVGMTLALILLFLLLVWVGLRYQLEMVPSGMNGRLKKIIRPYYPRVYRWAWLGLILFLAGGGLAGYLLYRQQQILESKIIILVTTIDGPESKNYKITEGLFAQLKDELSTYEDTLVTAIPESVTSQQGSDYARELGRQYTADIVLWGWYGATNNNLWLTLNIENLNEQQFSVLDSHEKIRPQMKIADLDAVILRQNINDPMSALLLYLRGFVRYQTGDFINALDSFNKALNYPEWKDELSNKKNILFYRGMTFLLQAQYDKAIADYTQSIQFDEKFYDAYSNRGVAYYEIGEYNKAIADCTQAIQLNSQHSWAYNNRGIVYSVIGENDKAIVDYTQAIQIDPDLLLAYYNRGNSYGDIGEYDKAIADYTEAIQLDPKFSAAYNNRGTVYNDKGENDKAIPDYTLAIQLEPNYLAAYYNRGKAYREMGENDKAIADYTQVIRLDPKYSAAYINRGKAYKNKGELDKAITNYTQAIQLGPNYSEAYYNRGLTYYAKGENDKAIADYTQVIQLAPKDSAAYNNRGIAYHDIGEYDKAIADYTQAIQLDPKYSAAYYNRGYTYDDLSKYDKAIADYTQAIQLDPKYSAAYSNRGAAYWYQGEYNKAIEDFTQAIQFDPKCSEAYNNRGAVYWHQGEYEKAIADYTQAIQLDPKYSVAYNNRGNAYYDKGEHDKAIADYTQAIQLAPKYSEAYYNRGIAYSGIGENDKAIADYTQAIQLIPKNADYLFDRARLYCKQGKNDLCLQDLKQAQQLTQDPALQTQINKLLKSLPTP